MHHSEKRPLVPEADNANDKLWDLGVGNYFGLRIWSISTTPAAVLKCSRGNQGLLGAEDFQMRRRHPTQACMKN